MLTVLFRNPDIKITPPLQVTKRNEGVIGIRRQVMPRQITSEYLLTGNAMTDEIADKVYRLYTIEITK